MHSLQFTVESSSNGMLERDFTVGGIPASSGRRPPMRPVARPLILMVHGGGNHKKHPAMACRAQHFVTSCGFHVALIDAPGHGDRPSTAHDEAEIAELFRARAAGEPEGPIVVRYNDHLAELAVPEYQATLDALQELPEIGTDGLVGFWGINMGTAIGSRRTARSGSSPGTLVERSPRRPDLSGRGVRLASRAPQPRPRAGPTSQEHPRAHGTVPPVSAEATTKSRVGHSAS